MSVLSDVAIIARDLAAWVALPMFFAWKLCRAMDRWCR